MGVEANPVMCVDELLVCHYVTLDGRTCQLMQIGSSSKGVVDIIAEDIVTGEQYTKDFTKTDSLPVLASDEWRLMEVDTEKGVAKLLALGESGERKEIPLPHTTEGRTPYQESIGTRIVELMEKGERACHVIVMTIEGKETIVSMRALAKLPEEAYHAPPISDDPRARHPSPQPEVEKAPPEEGDDTVFDKE